MEPNEKFLHKFLFCYFPVLLLLGCVGTFLTISNTYCPNVDNHFNCMIEGPYTVFECIAQNWCVLAAPPFWLMKFPARFWPLEISEKERTECALGYESTPILKEIKKVKKPNFVIVLLDDQDEVISPYLEAMPFSKKLFLENGTKYLNGFASTALCCPARCQLLTGLYGHNTGVLANVGAYGGRQGFIEPLDENGHRLKDPSSGKCINHEHRTISSLLQSNGNYATALFGKYLNGIEYGAGRFIPPGWSEFAASADHGLYTGTYYSMYHYEEGDETVTFDWFNFAESDYITDVVRDKAVNFVNRYRKADGSRPLFLYLSSPAPHFPLPPAPRHIKYVDYWDARFEEIVSSRPNYFNETEIPFKSSWLRNSYNVRKALKTHFFNRVDFKKRMATLYSVDEMVQDLHSKLTALGEIDNTVWVLTSDNGYNLGSHSLIHKMAPYDESIKVPFYISGPSFPSNTTIQDLALLQDIPVTFLELAGYAVPEYMDGTSLVPVKKANGYGLQQSRSAILIEYKGITPDYVNVTLPDEILAFFRSTRTPPGYTLDIPAFKAIRTHQHMMVDWFIHNNTGGIDHEFELYDVGSDPYELNNLLKESETSSENKEVFQKLSEKLQKLRYCKGKNCVL